MHEKNEYGNLLTPGPVMGVCLDLLLDKGCLFTEDECVEYTEEIQEWSLWYMELDENQLKGIKGRIYCNFVPSFIDTLHFWALLVEAGEFDTCIIDIQKDVVSKTDMVVRKKDFQATLALAIDSKDSKGWQKYKKRVRGDAPGGTIKIPLSMKRPRSPGNKRWYNEDDIQPVLNRLHAYRNEDGKEQEQELKYQTSFFEDAGFRKTGV